MPIQKVEHIYQNSHYQHRMIFLQWHMIARYKSLIYRVIQGGISISGAPVFNGRKLYVMAYNTWTNNGDGTYTSDAFYQNFVVIEYNIG